MSKEREIAKEQVLYYLIDLREQEAKKANFVDIVVNRELCKELGYFKYKIKETGEMRAGKLFLISETQDGELVNIIYDDKGRFIGWQNQESRDKNEIQAARDLELNQKQLAEQLIRENEKERIRKESKGTSSSDTTKAGEGRDLANKEHEEEKKQETVQQKPNSLNQEVKAERTLNNLKSEISIGNQPKIRLDTTINGYYLWQILQIEDKLKGRLPEGLNENSFRTGYLTILNASELEAKDGKRRKSEDVFVICTYGGDIIELDEQVLEPKPLGGLEQRKQTELTRQRYEDGKESEKPDTETELTRTSLYKIPDANSKFAVAENWFLAVDKNRDRMTNGKTPVDNVEKNISFVQVSRNQSYYTSEENLQYTLEYKLDPIRENVPKSEKEIEKEEELRERKPNEVEVERAEHTNELVDICFEKYKKLGDIYNRTDIAKKIDKYHNRGMNDEEVIKQIGADAKLAEEVEHEYHIHNR